jgi:hypothetical protein
MRLARSLCTHRLLQRLDRSPVNQRLLRIDSHACTRDLCDPQISAERHRRVTELEAIAEKRGYWSNGIGELHPICPECARREFGHRT